MSDVRHEVPLTRPSLGEDEVAAVSRAIRSGWVTQGPEVAAFEEEFAEYVGAPHACAVSNCTVALHLALRGLGVGPGDEVVTVSHSFIATANAVRYCGAQPVFVDIDPQTFNIDPQRVEQAFTRRTRALLIVHQLGMPADLASLLPMAHRRGLAVVEDAACAIGSEILLQGHWQRIGRPHGDVACFSFHPRKILTTGDGGMITTRDAALARRCRGWRQHSMSVPDTVRHGAKEVTFESYGDLGYNYRMTDMQAAMGRVQLARLPELLASRRATVDQYRRQLATIPGILLQQEPEYARTNWQSLAVRLPDGSDQRAVMQYLVDAGIACRRGVMSAHREPAYAAEPWSAPGNHDRCAHGAGICVQLAQSSRATERTVILPLFAGMTSDEQNRVVETLAAACQQSAQALDATVS